ncbi:hypothetical protein TNCV_223191 [Trichonephila clavipes]|nr:hypothetical protein TNCV_223191 [Trichonephila clavipes]
MNSITERRVIHQVVTSSRGVNSHLPIHNRFYGFTSWSRTTPIDCPWIFMINQLGSGHGVIVYCLNSGSEGFVNGILETGGVMDKCVQMWTRNYGALCQTARVCFGVLCANKKEEVKRDFGDLRIRRSEGRVVNTPLVFKRVLFRGDPKKKKRGGDPKGEVKEKTRAGRLRKRRGESQIVVP